MNAAARRRMGDARVRAERGQVQQPPRAPGAEAHETLEQL